MHLNLVNFTFLIGFHFKHPSTKLANNRNSVAGATFLKTDRMNSLFTLGANCFLYLRIFGNFDKRNHINTLLFRDCWRQSGLFLPFFEYKTSLCVYYNTHFTQNNPIKILPRAFLLAFFNIFPAKIFFNSKKSLPKTVFYAILVLPNNLQKKKHVHALFIERVLYALFLAIILSVLIWIKTPL